MTWRALIGPDRINIWLMEPIVIELPQLDPIRAAILKLASALDCMSTEILDAQRIIGRVLVEELRADRDSPPLDVSAMDGYAVRFADVTGFPIPVAGTSPAGSPPKSLPPSSAIRIFTGAPVPVGADCVIRREDTLESLVEVSVQVPASALRIGQNIRRRGENSTIGSTILPAGTVLTPTAIAATATFAPKELLVRRRVRVVVLNTGDELIDGGEPVEAWQIRDSNGPLLEAWLKQLPWVEFLGRQHVGDTLAAVEQAIAFHLPSADAVLLTGGVSMGDADYVPEAIERLGGAIAFHRLPIRPGKPVLGASLGGKLLLGLPGNPVSVAVVSRVIGLPLLRRMGGISPVEPHQSMIEIEEADAKTLSMYWFRLIACDANGLVRLVPGQGSGDLVALAQSDGFVELPPETAGRGPWRVTWW